MIWSGTQLSEALEIEIDPALRAGKLQFNSKDVTNDDLFIALAGNNDGHLYAHDAIKRRARAVIVERKLADIPLNQQIIVDDTKEALNKLALYKRKHSKAKFIAITGSVGKTTTKEVLKLMLSKFGKVFASRGNFNNYLGVPINLASMADDINYAVFEIGMNQAGEIRELCKIVKPDIAIITTISEAHIGFFKSVEEIADAKCEIFEGLNQNGFAIINADNKYYDHVVKNIQKKHIKNVFSFSHSKNSHSKLLSYKNSSSKTYLEYQIYKYDAVGNQVVNYKPYNENDYAWKYELILEKLIPQHYAVNFAACLLTISLLYLDIPKAMKSLNEFEIEQGRGKLINAEKDHKVFQLICDYYNASPESLKAALNFLKHIEHTNKILIIGDMLELGYKSMYLHQELVPYIVESGACKILLVGSEVKYIKDALPKNIYVKLFDNVNLLIDNLEKILEGEELILIKGSRGMRLEKVLNYFDVNQG